MHPSKNIDFFLIKKSLKKKDIYDKALIVFYLSFLLLTNYEQIHINHYIRGKLSASHTYLMKLIETDFDTPEH
jgi:hypothetical protein